jgi:hypothetical protein
VARPPATAKGSLVRPSARISRPVSTKEHALSQLFDLRVSHAALGVSRILYHAAVLWLVFDLWRFQEVAYANARVLAAVLLPVALVVNAALVLGLWTRPLLIANAVLLRVVFGLSLDGYTVDDIVENTSLVWAMAPAPRTLALDARGDRRDPGALIPAAFVLLAFAALELLYGDGLRYKFASQVWREGSAFWLGAALPHFSSGLLPRWAEIDWLMRACTWGALAYETLFPLILVRRARAVMATLGLIVHAGSGLFMALPQFGLLMASLIALFLPWDRLVHRQPAFAGAPAPRWQLAPAAYALVALMAVGQISLNFAPAGERNLLCRALGLYQRAIFNDWHFLLPGPLFRFALVEPEGKERAIPSFDERGYPQLHDRYWKLFGFTLRAADSDFREPAYRYVRGWLERQGRSTGEVRVYCRDARLRTLGLDFGAVEELQSRPWTLCGTITVRPPQRGASGPG